MILYGASGHAKVITDAINDANQKVIHLFDDDAEKKEFSNVKVTLYDANKYPEEKLIISIGNNSVRQKIAHKVSHEFDIVIHSSSAISSKCQISEGSVILQNATIQTESIIGKHCIINTSCSIDHECNIDDFVHISPNATLCGNVTIGEGAHIGAGAVVLPNIKIGKWATIGAGAVIIQDVPNNAIVVGNPGKILNKTKK